MAIPSFNQVMDGVGLPVTLELTHLIQRFRFKLE